MLMALQLAFVRFESPAFLLLLALIPLIVLLSFRSLAGLGPVRRWLAIALRCAVVLVAVFGLAGMQRVVTNEDLWVVFLLDRSSSVPADCQEKAYAFVGEAAKGMRPDDRMALVAFDGVGAVEQLPHEALKIDQLGDPIEPDRTDLGAAARLGMAMFTDETMRRVVVFSDGNENSGDVLEEAKQFASSGVPIDIVLMDYEHRNEVVFETLHAPPLASEEETIVLRAVLRSTCPYPVTGRLRLRHNRVDVPMGEDGGGMPVTLAPNAATPYEINVPLRSAGRRLFEAWFEPDDPSYDQLAANNRGSAFTFVSGQGDVVILTTDKNYESSQFLQKALEREKVEARIQAVSPGAVDFDPSEASLVIIDNVPAYYFSDDQKKQLAAHVREFGLGLMMIGGDESFGAGGWQGSPLEEVMPVSFEIKARKQIPRGALVLVMHACEVPQGNKIGERAAIEAAKTLSSLDYLGVLAWDWQGTAQSWTVPFAAVGDKRAVIQKIKQMSMGDLPDLYPLMKAGVDALLTQPRAMKHMVVISDFDPMFDTSPNGSGTRLLKTMRDNNISCSTIAIGWGGHMIDQSKAKAIADGAAKNGEFHACKNLNEIPRIFIKEATLVRRKMIVEETFQPTRTNDPTPILGDAGFGAFPSLDGYVVTGRKPLAQTPLVRHTDEADDPILAHWEVGLGKVVAFTSGMWPRWGAQWPAWARFSNVWAQAARWAARQSEASAFDVVTTMQGDRVKVRVDALDKNADAIDGLTFRGAVLSSDGEAVPLELRQSGPGVYEGEFDALDTGAYFVGMTYRLPGEETPHMIRTGVAAPYSPEYRELSANAALLEDLRRRTGGRDLTGADPLMVYDRSSLQPAESRPSVWEDLIRLMLVVFLLDVAVRRIAINPAAAVRALRQRVAEAAGGRQQGERSAAVLASLKGASERARDELRRPPSETGKTPDRAARYEPKKPDAKATEELSKALGGASEAEKPVVARPTRKAPPTDEGEYTSRLLAAKRRAQKRRDDEQNEQK